MSRFERGLLRLLARHEKAKRKHKPPRVPTLTERQRAFVDAYLWKTTGNATEAARLVGYKWPGKVGPALVHHPLIKPILNNQVDLMVASHRGPLRAGLLSFR
ncbi:terminase small subunit [Paludisphaera soli]|uniref:terminase small subunit n=1 Tax=Paludisphaera soli TaxID=2712865 RepID=UPI0013EC9E16|nr:terminase small subunit [Paludisphaera soli]